MDSKRRRDATTPAGFEGISNGNAPVNTSNVDISLLGSGVWANGQAIAEDIARHTPEAVALLREVLATRTLAQWVERFGTLSGPWAPVRDILQVGADPQVTSNGCLRPAGELQLAASPVQFDVTAADLAAAPAFAAPDRTDPAGTRSTGTASRL